MPARGAAELLQQLLAEARARTLTLTAPMNSLRQKNNTASGGALTCGERLAEAAGCGLY